jgi:hypothetical protein
MGHQVRDFGVSFHFDNTQVGKRRADVGSAGVDCQYEVNIEPSRTISPRLTQLWY